jgi:hypothetical protein
VALGLAVIDTCWLGFVSGFSYLVFGWELNSLDLNSSKVFGFGEMFLVVGVEEGDAEARSTGSCCSSSSMDVGLGLFWWLDLDDKVNLRDIKSSGRNIGGNEDLELSVLESLDCDLTLILGDTTMHYLDVVVNGFGPHELVSVIFRLCKHNDLSGSAVDSDDFAKCVDSVFPWAFHCDVPHIFSSFV